jgi:hypothetical protein
VAVAGAVGGEAGVVKVFTRCLLTLVRASVDREFAKVAQ